jgi:hypothetical protein
MATPLSDGNPLTYDWLNLLVGEINTLSSSSALGRSNVKLQVLPNHFSTNVSANTVNLVTGAALVSLGKGKTRGKTAPVKFKTPFLSDDVLVVANVNYKGTDPGVDAVWWVTNIDETGCQFWVRRFDAPDKKQTTKVTINYIAIGKAKTLSV